jgi:hypothetical protein
MAIDFAASLPLPIIISLRLLDFVVLGRKSSFNFCPPSVATLRILVGSRIIGTLWKIEWQP